MSQEAVPPQNRPQRRMPSIVTGHFSDPALLRPTVLFLLGLLIGTVVIAATRPLPSSGWHPAHSSAASTDKQIRQAPLRRQAAN